MIPTLAITRTLLLMLLGMLCASSALAVSYSIVPNYDNDLCQSIRSALAEGLVLDAEKPICERRFELSPKAKEKGFTLIDKTLLPQSSYAALLLRFYKILGGGGEATPLSTAEKNKAKEIISNELNSQQVYIYSAEFDADNSKEIRKIYILYNPSCYIAREAIAVVYTFIEDSSGTLDPSWGVRAATAGIPVIYKDHTYYIRWKSWKGGVDPKGLAELNVFDAGPFNPAHRAYLPYAGFTPFVCRIFQDK